MLIDATFILKKRSTGSESENPVGFTDIIRDFPSIIIFISKLLCLKKNKWT